MDYFTYDQLIANGCWDDAWLPIPKRMSNYLVDGNRFGMMPLITKSGSPSDVHLDKRTSEIQTAALLFSYLQYENVRLISLDGDGKPLERPDLEARLPDGSYIGVEVAAASEAAFRKHESGRSFIETTISDLLESDHAFHEAFGECHFSLTLEGLNHQDPITKKDARSISKEIEEFIRSGRHTESITDELVAFPARYTTLAKRQAQYQIDSAGERSFSVNDGGGTISRDHRYEEVVRVLNDHRNSARSYRPLPTWIILFLNDAFEFFYATTHEVAAQRPPTSPFVKGYVFDAVARVVELQG